MKRFPYLYLLAVFLFCSTPLLEAAPPAQGIATSKLSPDKDTPAAEAKRLAKKAHEKGSVRILVELKEGLTAKDYAKIKQKKGKRQRLLEFQQNALMEDVPVRNTKATKRYEYLPYMALSVTEAELKNLRNSGRVAGIFEDHIDFPQSHEVSTAQIGAKVGWNLGFTGRGQTIAVIDSGVDKFHPYLQNKVVREVCFSSRIEDKPTGIKTVTPLCRGGRTSIVGKGAAQANCRVGDIGCAHGTFVAALAAGNSREPGFTHSGVAPEANIIAIKAESSFNVSQDCAPESAPCKGFFTSDELKALDYVLKINNRQRGRGRLHIAAVNMSLGGPAAGRCFKGPVRRTIQLLKKAKIATIVSSGNDGTPYDISFPACIPEAISVGATDPVTHAVSDFSNGGRSLDLLAPGQGIGVPYFAIDPSGAEVVLSGTSFSAPLVAGAWAALKSHKPNASVNEILQILQSTGVGVVDLRNATIKPEIRIGQAHSVIKP